MFLKHLYYKFSVVPKYNNAILLNLRYFGKKTKTSTYFRMPDLSKSKYALNNEKAIKPAELEKQKGIDKDITRQKS
jgi:hypothetical protein